MSIGRIRSQQLHPDYRPEGGTGSGNDIIVGGEEPVGQAVGGIWIDETDIFPIGEGGYIAVGNAVVSEEEPEGYKFWYDPEEEIK